MPGLFRDMAWDFGIDRHANFIGHQLIQLPFLFFCHHRLAFPAIPDGLLQAIPNPPDCHGRFSDCSRCQKLGPQYLLVFHGFTNRLSGISLPSFIPPKIVIAWRQFQTPDLILKLPLESNFSVASSDFPSAHDLSIFHDPGGIIEGTGWTNMPRKSDS